MDIITVCVALFVAGVCVYLQSKVPRARSRHFFLYFFSCWEGYTEVPLAYS